MQSCYVLIQVLDCNLLVFLQCIKTRELPTLRSFFGCLTNAIAYLHSRKIQHMDIKPENILIKNGDVYVADFGAAHDWSKKERSTTWSATPHTPRYIPPEVARDPHSPRNSSTDMWSLGVVFLEMVTVLRGRRVDHLRQYLVGHGTKHAYVYGNGPATYSWFEVLRKSDAGPDSDNEPLTWIKDLIQPDPLNRPNAKGLVKQLLESGSAEKFCGFCCSSPAESDWVENPASNRTHIQDTITVIVDDEDSEYGKYRSQFDLPVAQVLPEAKTQSIEAWLNLGENNISPDPANYGLEPSISDSSDLPYEVDDDDDDVTQIASATLVPNRVPQRLSNFDFFGDQHIQESRGIRLESQEAEENYDLAYDVVSDDSGSYRSEATVRPAALLSDPELAAILEDLDEEPLSPKQRIYPPSIGNDPQAMATSVKQKKRLYDKSNISHHGGAESQLPLSEAVLLPPNTHFVLRNLGLSSTVCLPPSQPPVHDTPIPQTPESYASGPNIIHLPPVPPPRFVRSPTLPSTFLNIPESRRPTLDPDSLRHTLLPPPPPPKRNHGPSPLTIGNLRKLDTHKLKNATPTTKKLRGRSRAKPKISAKVYMQDIWEAESSAATSIMSEGTRSKIGSGSLVRTLSYETIIIISNLD